MKNPNTDKILSATNSGHFKTLYVVLLAVPVGVISGYLGVLFRYAIEYMTNFVYGTGQAELATKLAELALWEIALPLMAVGLITGLTVKHLMPEGRMHAPADILNSAMYNNGRMPWRAGVGVFFLSTLSIGTGVSAGRFGPALVIGASFGAKIAEWLKLNRQMSLAILASSFGAIISASFNTPIAGAFFALEFVLGSYALANFAPAVVASLAGAAVSRHFFGNEYAFHLPTYDLAPVSHVPLFVILGAICALVAVAFIELPPRIGKLHGTLKIPPVFRPVVGGAVFAVMVYIMPQIAGLSIQGADNAMLGYMSISVMLGFLVFKLIATSICLGSGFAGGVFSPAILYGILVGGVFGVVVTHLGLGENLQGYYSLIATGAVASVILGAPISTILIIFEMSNDYSLTLGVMITTIVSSQLAQHYYGYSFFTKGLAGRGINVNLGREEMLLRGIKARDLMATEYSTLPSTATMAQVRAEFIKNEFSEIFIVDGDKFMGIVTPNSMGDILYKTTGDKTKKVAHVMIPPIATVNPTTNVEDIMHLMDEDGDQNLPVLDSDNGDKIVGVLMENDTLMAYRTIVQETRSSQLR